MTDVFFSQGVYSHRDLPELGPLMRTSDGKPGFMFKAYDKPRGNENRELLDEIHLISSPGFLVDYVNSKITFVEFYVEMEGNFAPEQDGIYDFGVTVVGTGQLFIDGELVVESSKSQRPGLALFNETVEEKGSKELKSGVKYEVLFKFGSAPTSDINNGGVLALGPGGFKFSGCRRLNEEESISNAVQIGIRE